jgi:6 kDa early secretory antigenic target
MSDGILKVNYPLVRAAAEDMGSMAAKMNEQLRQLESDAKPLIHEWSGEAQAAYAQRQQQWRTSAEQLTNMLTSLKTATISSLETIQGADKNAAGGFQ